MRTLLATLASIFLCVWAYAGDLHEDDSTHRIVYTINDGNGDHVTGQTPRITIVSWDGVNYYDFNDSQWESWGSATTKHQAMNEDSSAGYYWLTVTLDMATVQSGDITVILSNDDTTYADYQAEVINYTNTGQLIKIHR